METNHHGRFPVWGGLSVYHNRNGRFRAIYQLPVSSSSSTLTGNIHVDVHYYEDGNVALNTTKPVNISIPSVSAESIVSRIAAAERDYQEALNRAFVQTSEGGSRVSGGSFPLHDRKWSGRRSVDIVWARISRAAKDGRGDLEILSSGWFDEPARGQ